MLTFFAEHYDRDADGVIDLDLPVEGTLDDPEFKIGPIKTTIPACLDILSHNLFVKGEIDTGFIDRTL